MLIGINSNLIKAEGDTIFNRLAVAYCSAVAQAGGTPIILPCVKSAKIISSLLETIDGLIISGADDPHPSLYGEKLLPQTKLVFEDKQWADLKLIRLAWRKRIPTLGICYGMQLINVAFGGTLFHDIRTQLKLPSHKNRTHGVYISEDSVFYKIVRKPWIKTNSVHHQAIKELGKGLRISARSEDGLIEGIEADDKNRFFIGVQWHPERILDKKESKLLFKRLVSQTHYNRTSK